MMKTVAKGGVPQVPGMGPIPGAKFGGGKPQQQKKKGSRSGNPARRAAENAAIPVGGPASPAASGSGFGLGSQGLGSNAGGPTEEELASLQKFLGR